jgi:hypothetical protein
MRFLLAVLLVACGSESATASKASACGEGDDRVAQSAARAALDLANATFAFQRLSACAHRDVKNLSILFRENACVMGLEKLSAKPPWSTGHAMAGVALTDEAAADLHLKLSYTPSPPLGSYYAVFTAPGCDDELKAEVAYNNVGTGYYAAAWLGDEAGKTDVRKGVKVQPPPKGTPEYVPAREDLRRPGSPP